MGDPRGWRAPTQRRGWQLLITVAAHPTIRPHPPWMTTRPPCGNCAVGESDTRRARTAPAARHGWDRGLERRPSRRPPGGLVYRLDTDATAQQAAPLRPDLEGGHRCR